MQEKRIQLSRRKGFNLQKISQELNGLKAVKVARPSKFGNPFKIGCTFPDLKDFSEVRLLDELDFNKFIIRDGLIDSNDTAVRLYTLYINNLDSIKLNQIIHELKGKNLACFCSLDSACHADILLDIVNKEWDLI